MSEHEVDFRFDATVEDITQAFYDCGWEDATVKCGLLCTMDGESIRLIGPDTPEAQELRADQGRTR